MKKICLLFISALTSLCANSQDPYFSQFYSTPMILNPALAGSTGSGRLSGTFKTIGSDFSGTYNAYHFAYDQMINKIKSGVGLYYTGETWAFGEKSQRFGLNYAVPLKLGERFQLTPAVDLNFIQMKYPFVTASPNSGFVWNDTTDIELRDKASAFDPGTGILLNSKRLNLNIVAKHILQPNISPVKTGSGSGARYSIIADYVIGKADEKKSWKVTPGFRYTFINSSGGQNDVQFSVTAIYHKFKFGFAYRSAFDLPSDAASAVISYNGWLFKIRYAYDFFTRSLSGQQYSGHEVSLLYNIFNKKKKEDFVASPNFAF